MAFNQRKLDKAINQARGIFDTYIYRTDDQISEVLTAGYFLQSRYIGREPDDWVGGIMQCITAEGFVLMDIGLGGTVTVAEVTPTRYTGGYFDYNDLNTQTTPILVTGGIVEHLTNDTLGPFTSRDNRPLSVTDIWNPSTNQFDWTQLKIGDMLNIRLDVVVTTNSPNQEIKLDLHMAVGSGSDYEIQFSKIPYKLAEPHAIIEYMGLYMGDNNTLNFPAEFHIESDDDCSVVVNGWYCMVILRG